MNNKTVKNSIMKQKMEYYRPSRRTKRAKHSRRVMKIKKAREALFQRTRETSGKRQED